MSKLKIAYISDVHLGHPDTTTEHILENLRNTFPDNLETAELDVIFICGDLFDRLLNLPDDNNTEIELWAKDLLMLCKKNNIILRALEGTPSHEWKQVKLIDRVNNISGINADFKHITNLSIEYIPSIDKSILYVPDEWEPETDETWKQVVKLLKANNLEKVDFAVMHGCFPHQLPSHVKVPMHDPDRYLSIVKYIIVIGHIHKPAIWDRIYTPGSLDRLTHGEEEAKGHLRFYLNQDDTYEIKFIENKNAKIYKTISCLGLSVDDTIIKISNVVKKLPDQSHVRIEANKDDAIVVSLDVLKSKFPKITWKTKIATKDNSGKEMLVDMRARFRGIDITKQNLLSMVIDKLHTKAMDVNLINECERLLIEAQNNARYQ